MMMKVVRARYDATQNMLWLEEPLEGVRDHEMVRVRITVSGEETGKMAGEELSRIVNDDQHDSGTKRAGS